jgi:hypothetical protein
MYATPVTSIAKRVFLTYDKLPASRGNLAELEMTPHPGARVFDPQRPPGGAEAP